MEKVTLTFRIVTEQNVLEQDHCLVKVKPKKTSTVFRYRFIHFHLIMLPLPVQRLVHKSSFLFQDIKLTKQKSAEAFIDRTPLRVNNSSSEVVKRSKLPRAKNAPKSY